MTFSLYTEEELADQKRELQKIEFMRIFHQLVLPEERALLLYRVRSYSAGFHPNEDREKELVGQLDSIYENRDRNDWCDLHQGHNEFPDPVDMVQRVSVDEIRGRAGSWGAAGFYRRHLRTLEPGEALAFTFEDDDAFTRGRYSIITAASSMYGSGRTRTRSDKRNLTFYIWLREHPNPAYLPNGGDDRQSQRPANLELVRKTDKPS